MKKIPQAKHRIIGKDTPKSVARRRATRAQVESEKAELFAQARKLMSPIIEQRKELAAIMADLRAERERQGLSLTDVAERTGLARESIHRLETAKAPNPTLSTLQRYANALGLALHMSLS